MATKKVFIAGVTPVEEDFSLRDYSHLRGYHGCRPIDLGSYQKDGIRPITYQESSRDMLQRIQNAKVPKEELLTRYQGFWRTRSSVQDGVWFTLTREELIDECGHYLIAGSEFLLAFATGLFLQYELRKTGTPTIFHCDVPIQLIDGDWLDSMERSISEDRLSPCGFRIHTALAPELIVKTEHPKRVLDPHHGYCVYRPD